MEKPRNQAAQKGIPGAGGVPGFHGFRRRADRLLPVGDDRALRPLGDGHQPGAVPVEDTLGPFFGTVGFHHLQCGRLGGFHDVGETQGLFEFLGGAEPGHFDGEIRGDVHVQHSRHARVAGDAEYGDDGVERELGYLRRHHGGGPDAIGEMRLHVGGRGLRRQRAGHVDRPVRVGGHVDDGETGGTALEDPDRRPVDAVAVHLVPDHRAVPVVSLKSEETGRNTQQSRPGQVVQRHAARHLGHDRARFIRQDIGLLLRARDPVHPVDHVHDVAADAHYPAGPVDVLEHETQLPPCVPMTTARSIYPVKSRYKRLG